MTAAVPTKYVALLRGINVGGNNKVAMSDLAAAFRHAGYDDVRTLLASGNVVFAATGTTARRLEAAIEALLKKAFGTAFPTLVLSRAELAKVIDGAPKGHDSPTLRADVFFLKHPLTAKQALAEVPETP